MQSTQPQKLISSHEFVISRSHRFSRHISIVTGISEYHIYLSGPQIMVVIRPVARSCYFMLLTRHLLTLMGCVVCKCFLPCLFILLLVPLAVQKLLSLRKSFLCLKWLGKKFKNKTIFHYMPKFVKLMLQHPSSLKHSCTHLCMCCLWWLLHYSDRTQSQNRDRMACKGWNIY